MQDDSFLTFSAKQFFLQHCLSYYLLDWSNIGFEKIYKSYHFQQNIRIIKLSILSTLNDSCSKVPFTNIHIWITTKLSIYNGQSLSLTTMRLQLGKFASLEWPLGNMTLTVSLSLVIQGLRMMVGFGARQEKFLIRQA